MVYKDAKKSLISKDIASVQLEQNKQKERDRIRVLFDQYDDDGGGTLDRDELQNMCAAVGYHNSDHSLVLYSQPRLE
jgi:Ca2+-binding EF-hand superfamily protein